MECSRKIVLAAATVALGGWLAAAQPAWSQSADGGRSDETAALRARVAQLEKQNEEILRSLAELRELLNQDSRATFQGQGVQVASATPIVPANLPAAAAAPRPPAQAAAAPAPPPTVITEGNKSELSFYGFIRADAIIDDSRANSFQAPTLIRPEPNGAENRSNFTFHPRLTRLGFNYRIPAALGTLAGARVSGKFEFDFQNGGRESRAIPRYRHAYMQLSWGPSSLLLGQSWDIISPLFPAVNADTLMWNAGNLGDRRMQIRYSHGRATGVNLQMGAGLTGAVDGQDLDANGVLDGEASAMPNFQGRLGYVNASSKVLVGVWSHFGRLHTDSKYNGKDSFNGYSYGADYEFRFSQRVSLRGELFAGSNLGDIRGGVGQSFNTATGREIDSRGGWIELGLRNGRYGFSTGFTMDDPRNGQIGNGAAALNRSWYVTNQFRLAPPITIGVDYLYWQTRYKGIKDGTDNRFNLYMIYGF